MESSKLIEGLPSIHLIDPEGNWHFRGRTMNDILYSWGFIVAQQLRAANQGYHIRKMYIEFENVASPGDPAGIPVFTRDEGLEYYNNLGPSNDFLRVDIIQTPGITIAPGFESYFTDGVDGNELGFVAQTSGTTGVLGRTFSDTVNSTVIGGALIASPDPDDRTKDVIFNRGYFDVAEQVPKEAGSQVGITWPVRFK
jgi:hypothetical protein